MANMKKRKLRAFIGCTNEGIEIAEHLQARVEGRATATF